MDIQTYQNSYRIRQKWHFIDNHSGKIDKISPKKQTESIRSISPSSKDKQTPGSNVNTLGYTQNQYLSKKTSEIAEKNEYERLMKLKAKQFISKIKREKTNRYKIQQSKQVGKKINPSSMADSKSQKSIKQQQIVVKYTHRNKNQLMEKDNPLAKKNRRIKTQPQIIKPHLTLLDQTEMRNKPIKFVILDQHTPLISKKKVSFEQKDSFSHNNMEKDHKRSRSVNTQSSSPHLSHNIQKYLYLNIEDEKKIDLIYKKIKKLSAIDYTLLPCLPNKQKSRPFYL